MDKKRRVVVTGIGVVSPNGIGKGNFWEGIKNGKSGIGALTRFDATDFPSRVAAEVNNFEPLNYLSLKEIKKLDRTTYFAIAAAKEAVGDGQIKIEGSPVRNTGVVFGTFCGGIGYAEREMLNFYTQEYKKMSPYTTTATFCGSISGEVSTIFNFRGPSYTISNGCNSSSDSVGMASQMIRNGVADVILAGGAEAPITPGVLGALCQMKVVSTSKNHAPTEASCPFSLGRDGFIISEGAYMLVLEELDHALQRKTNIYAEIVGYGSTCRPYDGSGIDRRNELREAITLALDEGCLKTNEKYYICAHGISSPTLDEIESQAIKEVFGARAAEIAISSIKSMIGFPLAAGGAANIIAAVLALENNYVPPTINYDMPDPRCDLNYIPNKGQSLDLNAALCISMGIRSKSSVVAIKKFPRGL